VAGPEAKGPVAGVGMQKCEETLGFPQLAGPNWLRTHRGRAGQEEAWSGGDLSPFFYKTFSVILFANPFCKLIFSKRKIDQKIMF
jgi:hypothetical protein